MLDGDEEGCVEPLGDPDGGVEGAVVDSDEGPEEGALLKLGSLEGNEEGWAERLGDSDGDGKGPVDGSDEGPGEGSLLKPVHSNPLNSTKSRAVGIEASTGPSPAHRL